MCVRRTSKGVVRALFAVCLALSGAALAAPRIQAWTLGNGARIYFVESRELPMLQLTAAFDAGAARDIPPTNGLAMLVNTILKDGAGNLDADEIAAAFDDVGAEYSTDLQRDMALISLRSLSYPAQLDPALRVFAQILCNPSFANRSLERERERALVALRQSDQSPGQLADRIFYRALYGNHSYALNPGGSTSGLKAVTRADVEAFHARYYVGANAVLGMVGNASPAAAHRIAERVLGCLPRGAAPTPIPPVPENGRTTAEAVTHVRFPSLQSHIRMGEVGMTRTDPDYFPLFVGNYILGGGGLVSRLADEVREKRGLSYNVYSYFLPLRAKGPFVLGLQTRAAQSDQALAVIRATLARFVAQGPSAAELAAAKKNLVGGFPLRIDSNRKIAEYLAVIGFYDLPLDYLDRFAPRVEAVTVSQIRDAFRRRVHPGNVITVIVGDNAQ